MLPRTILMLPAQIARNLRWKHQNVVWKHQNLLCTCKPSFATAGLVHNFKNDASPHHVDASSANFEEFALEA